MGTRGQPPSSRQNVKHHFRMIRTIASKLRMISRSGAGTAPQRPHGYPSDFNSATIGIVAAVSPYTMTSRERIFALREAVRYVAQNRIPGDIVECGVWKGGSMMAVALTLLEMSCGDRNLLLFDTFAGMPPPTEADRDFKGARAADLLATHDKETSDVWAYGPLEGVKRVLAGTGYDMSRISFVQGKVEETLPQSAPDRIALLRLDTDWYESTRHELLHLYPRLSVGGVLIIDDYGYWEGARRAVDEYIAENRLKLLLNRIDETGRICVKVE